MANIYYGDGASTRTMTAIYYQDGATLRTITEAWYQDGANLRKIWPAIVIVLNNITLSPSRVEPNDASATVAFNNTMGNISTKNNDNPYVVNHAWIDGSTDYADYEYMMTMNSGNAFTGTLDTWISGASVSTWGLVRGSLGSVSGVGTLSIRPAGGGSVIDTATITLTATQLDDGA